MWETEMTARSGDLAEKAPHVALLAFAEAAVGVGLEHGQDDLMSGTAGVELDRPAALHKVFQVGQGQVFQTLHSDHSPRSLHHLGPPFSGSRRLESNLSFRLMLHWTILALPTLIEIRVDCLTSQPSAEDGRESS